MKQREFLKQVNQIEKILDKGLLEEKTMILGMVLARLASESNAKYSYLSLGKDSFFAKFHGMQDNTHTEKGGNV